MQGDRDVQMDTGRKGESCVCVGCLVCPIRGDPREVSPPPQIKPEGTERKSGKKCKRIHLGTVHKDTVYASKAKWERGETGLEKTPNWGEKDDRAKERGKGSEKTKQGKR